MQKEGVYMFCGAGHVKKGREGLFVVAILLLGRFGLVWIAYFIQLILRTYQKDRVCVCDKNKVEK